MREWSGRNRSRAWKHWLGPAATALPCLLLAANLHDPHLLPVRNAVAVALLLSGLVGLAVAVWPRPGRGWWQAPVVVAWLAVIGLAVAGGWADRLCQSAVMREADLNPQLMASLGEHLVVGYKDIADIRELARRGLIGGVFVTWHNVQGKTPDQIRTELWGLQALRLRARLPPLMIATDQEGGAVSRLSPPLPQQPSLSSVLGAGMASREIDDRAAQYGAEQARALASLGVNANFSPVVDLKPAKAPSMLDRHTRIAERAVSGRPEAVTQVALAYSRALLAHGVMPTLKHFPGLGSVAADTHHFSADLTSPLTELNSRDWLPFRRVLAQTPAMLMIGHVTVAALDGERPASVSRKVLTGLVREGWKFDGILISDDMTMGAIYNRGLCRSSVEALNASMDLLLVAYDSEKYYTVMDCLFRAAQTGELNSLAPSRERLHRVQWRKDRGGSAQDHPGHDQDRERWPGLFNSRMPT